MASWLYRYSRLIGVVVRQVIVQNYVEQRPVHSNAVFIVDKAEIVEAVHEEADTGPGDADHLRQCLLRNLRNQCFRLAGLAEFGHQKENSRQPFFAGVEKPAAAYSLADVRLQR